MTRDLRQESFAAKVPDEIKNVLEHNHKTEHMLEAKKDAKAHGAAGRFRGKAKAKQNNKARGGKLAR
jgi:hypothetical protein